MPKLKKHSKSEDENFEGDDNIEEREEKQPTFPLSEFEGNTGIIPVYNTHGDIVEKTDVPKIFETPVRHDIIKRAVLAIQSKRFQPQGRDPLAGKKTTAESRGVGLGLARIPRVKGQGTRRSGQGTFAPGTVGGRIGHPPRSEKVIVKKINNKERKMAIKSAIAATGLKDCVQKRGHKLGALEYLPIVVENSFEEINNAKTLKETLIAIGLDEEVERIANSRKVRAGKGKKRGRRIKHAIGPLLIIDKDKGISKAAANIQGIDVSNVKHLNAELLAPGTYPGRLTIWSLNAFQSLNNFFS